MSIKELSDLEQMEARAMDRIEQRWSDAEQVGRAVRGHKQLGKVVMILCGIATGLVVAWVMMTRVK